MASYQADQLKGQGNDAFRNGDYQDAENFYSQAVSLYSRNPLIFTNRANARLKLQKWEGAVNDCLKSIEITGQGHNHKAYYFLAQAQLSLQHPREALSSALTAYEQVLRPAPAARISPNDLMTFSAFVLKCKKAKFAALDRDRLQRRRDLCAELEDLINDRKQQELQAHLSDRLRRSRLGSTGVTDEHEDPVEAEEREQIVRSWNDKASEMRSIFATADPANHKPREVPDHIIDMITFEPMVDPVITIAGTSYERSTIYEHLKRSQTDPLTREKLTIHDLRNNYGLKAACDEFWDSGASEWIGDW